MAHIIAFANQKGGVGKTMTVAATASILVQEGYQVLLIDLDAQRNLDMVAGDENAPSIEIKRNDLTSLSILDVLQGNCTIKEAIVPSAIGDLVRASNQLYSWAGNKALLDKEVVSLTSHLEEAKRKISKVGLTTLEKDAMLLDLMSEVEKAVTKNGKFKIENILDDRNFDHRLLEKALEEVKENYDYILIDTNPTLSLLVLNALYAAKGVVIPVFPESSSVEATLELYETMMLIKKMNPSQELNLIGVLMTKYSSRRLKSKRHEILLEHLVEKQMKSYLFKTKIRESERASEYVEARLDIVRYDPTGNSTMDYRDFVQELKLRLSGMEGSESTWQNQEKT